MGSIPRADIPVAVAGFPWLRALLLVPLVWWTLALGSGVRTWCFLDFVNLAFHEAGHLFFGFAGSTMHYLGGTLAQLLVPLIVGARFLFSEQPRFGVALCVWWLGQNLINIAVYMADARELALPLVGGGDHDWNELFFRFGWLTEPAVERVAASTHGVGVVLMLLGLAWSICFVLPPRRREELFSRLAARWPRLAVLLAG